MTSEPSTTAASEPEQTAKEIATLREHASHAIANGLKHMFLERLRARFDEIVEAPSGRSYRLVRRTGLGTGPHPVEIRAWDSAEECRRGHLPAWVVIEAGDERVVGDLLLRYAASVPEAS